MTSILLSIFDAIAQGSLWGIMAIGIFITFRVLDQADMTVDGSFAFGGAISAVFITRFGVNPFVALLISFLGGMLAGLVTGVLHTKLKIPAILAGILTMLALYSVNIRIMASPNISLGNDKTVVTIIQNIIDTKRNVIYLILGVAFGAALIALLYWFFGTEIGSVIRATGDNENMVRAQGFDTDYAKIISFMFANAIVAVSGGLVAQTQSYADVNMGIGAIAIGLASIIIGELFVSDGSSFFKRLAFVIVGSVLYRIVISVVLQLGLKTDDLKLLTSITIILALTLLQLKREYSARTKKGVVKNFNAN